MVDLRKKGLLIFKNLKNKNSEIYLCTLIEAAQRSAVQSSDHGLRTPNEGINQRNLKIKADVADKICFGRT